MKKLLFLSLLLALPLLAIGQDAQQSLIIHQRGGGTAIFPFSSQPVITFVDNNLHVESNDGSITVALNELDDFVMEETVTAISHIQENRQAPTILNGTAVFDKLPAGSIISIYSADGKLVGTHHADNIGQATIDLLHLSRGIHIIKSGNTVIKITTK